MSVLRSVRWSMNGRMGQGRGIFGSSQNTKIFNKILTGQIFSIWTKNFTVKKIHGVPVKCIYENILLRNAWSFYEKKNRIFRHLIVSFSTINFTRQLAYYIQSGDHGNRNCLFSELPSYYTLLTKYNQYLLTYICH